MVIDESGYRIDKKMTKYGYLTSSNIYCKIVHKLALEIGCMDSFTHRKRALYASALLEIHIVDMRFL